MLVNETFTQKIPTILAPTGSVYYMYMYDVGQKEAYTTNVDIRTCLQSANLHGVSSPRDWTLLGDFSLTYLSW